MKRFTIKPEEFTSSPTDLKVDGMRPAALAERCDRFLREEAQHPVQTGFLRQGRRRHFSRCSDADECLGTGLVWQSSAGVIFAVPCFTAIGDSVRLSLLCGSKISFRGRLAEVLATHNSLAADLMGCGSSLALGALTVFVSFSVKKSPAAPGEIPYSALGRAALTFFIPAVVLYKLEVKWATHFHDMAQRNQEQWGDQLVAMVWRALRSAGSLGGETKGNPKLQDCDV